MKKYQLIFEGASTKEYRFPRYRRAHRTIANAEAEANRIWDELDRVVRGIAGGTITACHNAMIYGPGCGDAGRPVRMSR